MSLSRNLFKDTRFFLIASASGAALFAQHLPSEAFDSIFTRPRQAATQQQTEPARLQLSQSDVRSISSVNTRPQTSGRTVQTQYQQPTSADARVKNLYGGQPQATVQTPQPAQRPAVQTPTQQRAPQQNVQRSPQQQYASYASSQYGVKRQAQQKYAQAVQQQPSQQQVAQIQTPQVQQQQTAQQRPTQQRPTVTQTAATRSNKRSFFDRFVGKLKGEDRNIPNGPPQDPGMRYTPVSQAPQQQPQQVAPEIPQVAQQPNKFVPPPVPGVGSSIPSKNDTFIPPAVPGIDKSELATNTFLSPGKASVPKPRLFPTEKSASPIDHPLAKSKKPTPVPAAVPPSSFIPPMPGSGDELVTMPKQSAKQQLRIASPETQSFPELKAIMEGPSSHQPAEKTVVKVVPEHEPITIQIIEKRKPGVPAQALQAPQVASTLPKLEETLQPTPEVEKQTPEPKKIALVPPATIVEIPAPEELDIPALEVTQMPAAPKPAPEKTAPAPDFDPLANPFPDDVKQETQPAAVAQTTEPPAAEMKQEQQVVADTQQQQVTPPAFPNEDVAKPQEAPYTGLALEEDLFLKTKKPAPEELKAEELPMLPELPVLEQETKGEVALAPSMPELPLLPAPAEISDVSIPEKEAVVDVETVEKPPVEENPFAQNDKMEKPEEAPVEEKVEEKVIAEAPLQAPKFPEPRLTQPEETPKLKAPMLPAPQLPETKVAQATEKPKASGQQSKMELIASRKGLTGLKGFCPVMLRDSRELVDINDSFSATFNEKEYHFSSNEALQAFIADPEKYAPAIHGSDVIHLSLTGEEQEGSLDHAVWYKGRLYLFTSAETMETFVAAPSSHLTAL